VVLTRRSATDQTILFVDGQAQAAVNGNTTDLTGGPTIALGWTPSLHYRGAIDFLTVYDIALQPDVITQLYQGAHKSDLG
jgi:hypothetical protein